MPSTRYIRKALNRFIRETEDIIYNRYSYIDNDDLKILLNDLGFCLTNKDMFKLYIDEITANINTFRTFHIDIVRETSNYNHFKNNLVELCEGLLYDVHNTHVSVIVDHINILNNQKQVIDMYKKQLFDFICENGNGITPVRGFFKIIYELYRLKYNNDEGYVFKPTPINIAQAIKQRCLLHIARRFIVFLRRSKILFKLETGTSLYLIDRDIQNFCPWFEEHAYELYETNKDVNTYLKSFI